MQTRNPRLYGGREEQIAGASLRARGCPSTDRAPAPTRRRSELRAERESAATLARIQRVQVEMLTAQRAVQHAKRFGLDKAPHVAAARKARAEYLRLTGGLESRTVEVAALSESGLGVKAA